MNLVLTLGSAMVSKYGQQGFEQIDTALNGYIAASNANASLIYLDDAASMGTYGMPAIPGSTAGAILLGVRNLTKALTLIDSVLFIGGDDIVPYWRMTNPVRDRAADVDEIVYTDNPYGSARDELMSYLNPELSVGRLADSAGKNAGDFVAWIKRMTLNQQARAPRQGSITVFNDQWEEMSVKVSAALPAPVHSHAAPGFAVTAANSSDLNGKFLYFNLHGFEDSPLWRAFDPVRGQFVTAVDPTAFNNSYISGSVAFAENCYAGLTVAKTAGTSCALRLLQEGVAAFVAPSGLAFGSYLDSTLFLQNADFLAASFFRNVTSGSTPVGRALTLARQEYVANEPTPIANPFKQKTLMQFNLLGDPTL